MNAVIEILNRWGENFLGFMWPMLWQSSVLIIVIFAVDLVFARKSRAAVRYALWMVVLLKLLLPPALALPTGAVWWLWRSQPAVPFAPVVKNYTVSFDETTLDNYVPPAVPIVLPPPKLSYEAWAIIATAAVSAALLLWLVFRWWRVAGKVRRVECSDTYTGALAEARQLVRLRGRMQLKLIDEPLSPAVYGLFRPVILLPRALAEKLSERQLRAVLLHEAIHVRRGDVWVNCAQALLQIFYWWHPLLWVANARIRRVREEAVDDAVMVALRADADAYAPTLLEVAKFAFRRPMASLGLVGILESRSALRQRIERLVDFRPPRKAGITFLSLCGIFILSAVALPMGQGPAVNGQPALSSPVSETSTNAVDQDVLTEVFEIKNTVRRDDLNKMLLDAGVKIPPTIVVFLHDRFLLIRGTGDQLAEVRRVVWKLNGINIKPAPAVIASWPRETIDSKLKYIRLNVSYRATPLREVLRNLRELSQQNDPDKIGINFIFNPNAGTPSNGIDPSTGFPVKAPANSQPVDAAQIHVNLSLQNVSLKDLLNAICLTSDHPITYSVENYGVVFSAKATNAPPYEMRTFKVDTNTFFANLQKVASEARQSTGDVVAPGDPNAPVASYGGFLYVAKPNLSGKASALAKQFFTSLGIDMSPPKEMYYNGGHGVLFVYATPQDLDVIERAVQVLNEPAPAVGKNAAPGEAISNLDATQNAEENGITKQAASALNQALTEEHKEAHMDLVAQASTPVEGTSRLKLRAFEVDTKAVLANLEATGPKTFGTNVYAFLKELIEKKGVDLSPPKTIEYNEEHRALFVRATEKDLDVIAREIPVLNQLPTQIHIKARFLEVPKTFFAQAPSDYIPANMTNGLGLLTNPQLRVLLHYAESQKGTEELAEPEVTTLTERQTKMRATITQNVLTNMAFEENYTNNHVYDIVYPQLTKFETGPTLDTVPVLLSDNCTIRMQIIASLIKFYGYASPKGLPIHYATNSADEKIPLATILPAIRLSRESTIKNLYDGQTLVLYPKPDELLLCDTDDNKREEIVADHIQKAEHQYGDKVLVVLVTATLIDPAGNRFHSDDEIPFARNSFPPQSFK